MRSHPGRCQKPGLPAARTRFRAQKCTMRSCPGHTKALFSAPRWRSRRCALEPVASAPHSPRRSRKNRFLCTTMHNAASLDWRSIKRRSSAAGRRKPKANRSPGKHPDHCETNPIQNPPARPKLPNEQLPPRTYPITKDSGQIADKKQGVHVILSGDDDSLSGRASILGRE